MRAGLPPQEDLWREFLDVLALHGSITEVGPGRLEVVPRGRDDDRMPFWVLITPEQLVEYHVDRGGLPDLMGELDEVLGPRHDDESFVLVVGGEFVASMREELPVVRGGVEDELILQQIRQSGQVGEWFAHPPGEER